MYKDPITEFVECLYVNFDFDGAQKKLRECEQVRDDIVQCIDVLTVVFYCACTILLCVCNNCECVCIDQVLDNDFFLVACVDDFIENARLLVFETFCRIHQCITIEYVAVIP